MINGNLLGFGMFVLSGVLIVLPAYLLKLPNTLAMVTAGMALIVFDLILRLRNRGNEKWLMNRLFGGSLFFLPVWIFGIVMIAANLINALIIKK